MQWFLVVILQAILHSIGPREIHSESINILRPHRIYKFVSTHLYIGQLYNARPNRPLWTLSAEQRRHIRVCYCPQKRILNFVVNVGGLPTYRPFYEHGLTLILAWKSNYIHYKMYDKIIYPLPNFNGTIVAVWEWISNFTTHFIGHVITYPCWN